MERLKAQSLMNDSLLMGSKLVLWIHHEVQRAFELDSSFWPYGHYLVKHLEDFSRIIQARFDHPHPPPSLPF